MARAEGKGAPSGYSGTPLAKKLGIKAGHRVGLIDAPAGFERSLAPLPDSIVIGRQARGRFDIIVLFVQREADLRRRFAKLCPHLAADGGLWVAWPKKAAKLPTDLAFGVVQRVGLDAGLVDNKICAIDATFSGLRFVVRLQNRQDWPPG